MPLDLRGFKSFFTNSRRKKVSEKFGAQSRERLTPPAHADHVGETCEYFKYVGCRRQASETPATVWHLKQRATSECFYNPASLCWISLCGNWGHFTVLVTWGNLTFKWASSLSLAFALSRLLLPISLSRPCPLMPDIHWVSPLRLFFFFLPSPSHPLCFPLSGLFSVIFISLSLPPLILSPNAAFSSL